MDLLSPETGPGSRSEAIVLSFHHRTTVASLLICLTVIGLSGNVLVIISVFVSKKLRTVTNILVVNLAFADLLTCLSLPFQSLGLLSQTGRYPLHETVCAAVAGVMFSCVGCSGSTLVAISIIRWYVITRSVRGHQGIHTPKKIAIVVVIIWLQVVAFMVVPPALGLGTLGYSQYYGLCSLVDTNPLYVYYSILQGTLIAVGLTLSLIFYFLMFRHVSRHSRQIRDNLVTVEETRSSATHEHQNKASSGTRDHRPHKIQAINKVEIAITKNLFVVVCLVILCYLPISINLIIPGYGPFTLYSTMTMTANSVVNPIIYGFKHPNFREVFKSILCCRTTRG